MRQAHEGGGCGESAPGGLGRLGLLRAPLGLVEAMFLPPPPVGCADARREMRQRLPREGGRQSHSAAQVSGKERTGLAEM